MHVDVADGLSERLLHLKTHGVGHAARHRRDARAVFHNNVQVNVDRLVCQQHFHPIARVARQPVGDAVHLVFGRHAHHTIRAQHGLAGDGRNGVGRYFNAAQRVGFLCHNEPALKEMLMYGTMPPAIQTES